MKPELFLDENISISFDYKPKNAIESIAVLGAGAPDQQVIKYARKKNLTIVTGDRGIISNQINQGKTVYLADMEKCYLYEIKVKRVKKLKTKYDPVTHYLRCGDRLRMIRP